MAVENTTILIVLGIMFTYLVLYRKNRFFGNMAYMMISVGVWYFGTDDVGKVIGIVMFFGSFINMIYDLIYK